MGFNSGFKGLRWGVLISRYEVVIWGTDINKYILKSV